jgi:hypothetical protein
MSWVLETHLGGYNVDGQKTPEIQPDMIVDFKALMERSKPWPKTNNVGQFHYRKKPPITPATP